jgi:hypothetical protein
MGRMKKVKAFPTKIYVILCHDGEGIFPVAYMDIDSIPEDEAGSVIATYELVDTSTFMITKMLT